ncbi:MAG TPA: efflux RND transporter permease subunit [Steroidobacteraceae bacterium]|jgi:multidrug efflux pump subunit AcrB|nr:efflux RND transporter permease subunit [Steroidobacteraceae bacterium]
MLAIVRIALRRPYTFIVSALLILLIGTFSAVRMPVDIFPGIDIPIIAVAFQYQGLPPDQMAGRIITPFERALTTTVNDIEHFEANSYTTFGIVKIFFHPSVNIATANAQVTAIAQSLLKQMPAGTTPPLILNYSASTVPIIQLALSGKGLTEQNLTDLGLNFVRPRLITVQGVGIPWPFGGKTPQVMFDLDTAALQSRGLTGLDVAQALADQNLITPVGSEKIGNYEYNINLNSAPTEISELGDLPIKSVGGAMVYMHDVAQVHNGNAVQTNIVHVDGNRSVLLSVFKSGSTSTLDIVSGIKKMLAIIKPSLPDALDIKPIGDQSIFVRAAISGVIREGVIAAALTSLMILLFLGSARSTLIVTTSIPLSILGAIAALSAIGETLNIMTLGGLALAVGILVDEATVTIESINYHLEQGKDVERAILDGASQIVVPAFVSLLCICIVFIPMFFLSGVARFLFVPMAESVMFAMVFSFLLSRTLVPTMAKYLLRRHVAPSGEQHDVLETRASNNRLVRLQRGFEARFEGLRAGYHDVLALAMEHRARFLAGFLGFIGISFALAPFLGRNFFPQVDGGQILLHVRAPVGMRIEETAARFSDVEKAIRQVIPPAEVAAVADNIGTYISSINTIYNNTGTINESDGDIQISLNPGHAPTANYVKLLRQQLPRRFPGMTFAFLPADIVSQILNFGAPAPIDLQVRGNDLAADYAYAGKLLAQVRHIPGVADARIQQSAALPTIDVNLDRTRARYTGVTAADVTDSLVVNLASSIQVAPTYWLNEKNGVTYPIALQTPQYQIDTLPKLRNLPINASGAPTTVLGGIADIRRSHGDAVVSQYDIAPMVEIYATTQGRDLGAVSRDIQKIIAQNHKDKPKGAIVALVGQTATMNSAYSELLFGLLGAIVLVYLLIVINFQSWSDPFVIITALPAALAGIIWMLFATHTTLSVPALTGAIMCMGVATANSVLVISFAREKLNELGDATQAALAAGFVRLRPVLMTALAMVIGMLPMALGLGEGGEQNAPLGRAVIGGLFFATVSTLFFVPVVFSIIHRRYRPQPSPEPSLGGTHVPA